MDTPALAPPFELEARIRRSKGRTGRTFVASTKVTRSEQNELISAANTEGKAFSEWARETLLREARRAEDDPLFTELIAMRMLMLNLFKPLIMGKPVSQEWVTEVMAAIRKEKRKAALEVRQQYDNDRAGRQ